MLTFSIFLAVHIEDKAYAAELAEIAALDRSYYLNPCPTRTDRSNYAARQAHLEELRFQFYAKIDQSHESHRIVAQCRRLSRS